MPVLRWKVHATFGASRPRSCTGQLTALARGAAASVLVCVVHGCTLPSRSLHRNGRRNFTFSPATAGIHSLMSSASRGLDETATAVASLRPALVANLSG